MLSTVNTTLSYGGPPVIRDLSVEIPSGRLTVLLGPNGSGKSTLVKALAGALEPDAGEVRLNGRSLAALDTRICARKLAFLPQSPLTPEGLTVRELVNFGRHPHRRFLRSMGEKDKQAVENALRLCQLDDLAEQPVHTLSGGQRQRAWIALVLAQETDLLLLDEPTTFLDIAHQVEVLDLLAHLNRASGKTIVMVLHDINQAAVYADRIIMMKAGSLVAEGAPEVVLTENLLASTYGLRAAVVPNPLDGTPLFLPTTGGQISGSG